MDEINNAAFEIPDSLFCMPVEEQRDYDDRVKAYVSEALLPIPEARAVYLTPDAQRVIFQPNDLFIRANSLVNEKRYNAALPFYDESMVDVILGSIRARTTQVQVVNISFGFIHSTLVPDEYVFKYPSTNTFILPNFLKITHINHVENLRPYLQPEVVRQRIQDMFVDAYGFQVTAIISVHVVVWVSKFAIGSNSRLPQTHFINLRHVVWDFPTLAGDRKCVYRALAAHLLQQNTSLEAYVNKLRDLAQRNNLTLSKHDDSFDIYQTHRLEDLLKTNIRWFDASGAVLHWVDYTTKLYHSTKSPGVARMFVSGNHCAYIPNFDQFCFATKTLSKHTPLYGIWGADKVPLFIGCGAYWRDKPIVRGGNCWTFSQTHDKKCFVRCIAAFMLGSPICTKELTIKANKILRQAVIKKLTLPPPRQHELDLHKLQGIEDLLAIHIRVHDGPRSKKYENLEHTAEAYPKVLDLLVVDDHYAVISNFSAFNKQYLCHDCQRNYSDLSHLARHRPRCTKNDEALELKTWKFMGGLDKPTPDLFTTLQHVLVCTANMNKSSFRQPFVFFDIECSLSAPTVTNYTSNEIQRVEQEHVPVSVAFAYSENKWHVKEPTCYVSDGDPKNLVAKFYDQLKKIYLDQHARLQHADYNTILEGLEKYAITLEQNIIPDKRRATTLVRKFENLETKVSDDGYGSDDDDDEVMRRETDPRVFNNTIDDLVDDVPMMSENEEIRLKRSLKIAYKLLKYYDMKAYRMDVVGFNSSKYDLNALRKYLIPLMNDGNINAVKRNNRYLVLSNTMIRFTDIWLFLAPTTNFDSFVKAYLRKDDYDWLDANKKLCFPYEWLTSVDVLKQTEVPGIDYFTSMSRKTYMECSNENVKKVVYEKATEKRALCMEQFEQLGCKTMGDFLVAYNKADVSPGIVAIQHMLQTYMSITNHDLFEFITLASLAKRIALDLTPPGGLFMRFKKAHAQYYHDVRGAIVGGASIVWTRMAEAEKTKIRPYEYGNAAMTVKRVIGLDMSGCYLFATSQEHFTGPYFIREEASSFKIENDLRNIHSVLAIEFYVYSRWGQEGLNSLIHQFRGGEKRLFMEDGHMYSVDGYLEVDGQRIVIEYNGCYYHNHTIGCTLQGKNTNKKFNDKLARIRHEQILASVDDVIILHECDWYRRMKLPAAIKFCSTHMLYRTWLRRKSLAQAEIVPMIMRDELKGLFEVDAYVPKARRQDFLDVQPFFYQYGITWDMIGETMQEQLVKARRQFTKPHRLLVNPPFCQKQFLPHYYIKWLVEHGIVIHHVYRILEYPLSSTPFRELGELICRERQKAASSNASEQDKASADSWKLIGNSIYGQFCMAPDKFTTTRYMNAEKLSTNFLRLKINSLDCLSEDVYELTYQKPHVTVKQCPQMALGVYMHAKLRMLAFEYDLSRILDRKKYCLMLTDTDSYYFALAEATWEQCVRDNVTDEQVQAFKEKYFCLSPDKSKYMGLFHVEFDGHTLIALQPKMYFACGDDTQKTATRGIGKRESQLDISAFRRMLQGDDEDEQAQDPPAAPESNNGNHVVTQRSIRVLRTNVVTMRATTSAFNAFYYKRKVMPNNVDTADLDWHWPPEFNL